MKVLEKTKCLGASRGRWGHGNARRSSTPCTAAMRRKTLWVAFNVGDDGNAATCQALGRNTYPQSRGSKASKCNRRRRGEGLECR